MIPKFVKHCPVCGKQDSRPDLDFPDTMENCNHCGAEWDADGKLTYDSRQELTEGEVLAKGWFVDVLKQF